MYIYKWLRKQVSITAIVVFIVIAALAMVTCAPAYAYEGIADATGNAAYEGDMNDGETPPGEDPQDPDPSGGDQPGEEPGEEEKIDLSEADIVLSGDRYAYTGSEIKPEVTVSIGETILTAGTDYEVEYLNNTEPGTASVKVTGIGDYTGEKTAEFSIYREGWVKESGKWYYYKDGNRATGWLKLSNKWYYMDAEGAMQTGWQKISNKWYYFNASGVMQTGWQKIDGSWYYFNTSGIMQTGWNTISGKEYYLKPSGIMAADEWIKYGKYWYWLNASGVKVKDDWVKYSGYWYYVNDNGRMVVDKWIESGNSWYCLDDNGRMIRNSWVKNSSYWYYLGSSGRMAKNGWVKDSGSWYWVDGNGRMLKNRWVTYSGNFYYMKSSGKMATSEWVKSGGDWYWLNKSGAMSRSRWQKINGCWYYFYSDGTLETAPYVYISISEQTLYYCNNGGLVMSTPVVTGNKGNHDTPTGERYLLGKATNMHLKGLEDDGVTEYDSFVRYWMPFIGGEFGLHDADWRWYFGGDIYDGDGSHGCVNMPVDAAAKLFSMISVGTKIVIY